MSLKKPKKLIKVCLRCGRECEDFKDPLYGYMKMGLKNANYCRKCRLVFYGVDYHGMRSNRIHIFLVFPRDRCKFCYALNPFERKNTTRCWHCGRYFCPMEFKYAGHITFGLAKMMLDGRRIWNDDFYGVMPPPEKNEYQINNEIRFVMSMMFGNNKNFKKYGIGYGSKDADCIKFGEVFAQHFRLKDNREKNSCSSARTNFVRAHGGKNDKKDDRKEDN